MRLIDADAYQFPGDLANEPTIDAVTVVRCKDCKHFDSLRGECYGQELRYTEDASLYVGDEDFCSYGERKDNG